MLREYDDDDDDDGLLVFSNKDVCICRTDSNSLQTTSGIL